MQDHDDFSNGTRGAVASASGKTRITLFLDDEPDRHQRLD